jgi:hypothetical protein
MVFQNLFLFVLFLVLVLTESFDYAGLQIGLSSQNIIDFFTMVVYLWLYSIVLCIFFKTFYFLLIDPIGFRVMLFV